MRVFSSIRRPSSQLDTPLTDLPTTNPSPLRRIQAKKRHWNFNPQKRSEGPEDPAVVAAGEQPEPAPAEEEDEQHEDLSLIALTFLMLGICLAAFLVALDRTIISTAIPRITDDFNSPSDVGWYGSAYLLTACAFQPTYGRVFEQFNVRWAFCAALGLFELGSLLCGAAPSSSALIVGRAIAGIGCAGIFAGCLVIIAIVIPLQKRPIYMALVGSIFGVGSVCGPVLGGVFTAELSWRWCFYINLPIGAVTVATLLLCFHPKPKQRPGHTFASKILGLDLVGNLLLITAVVMLLLALQWGGETYPWRSAQIIGLLIGAGLQTIVFFFWERCRGAAALIPLCMLRQRTVASSLGLSFFISGTTLVHAYYLPFWFQVIQNVSPTKAGVNTIPYFLGNFAFAMVAGVFVTKFGYYNPPALLGPVVAAIGSGLISTFNIHTSAVTWAGYEVLAAAGVGLCIQQGIVAIQTVLPSDLLSIGTSLVMFAQSLAGAVFVSVGNSLQRNELGSGLEKANIPNVDVASLLKAGATEFRRLVPDSALGELLKIYNESLKKVFIMGIPLCVLGLLAAALMEWKYLKGKAKIPMK